MRFRTKDLKRTRLKDAQKRPCPEDLRQLLQDAGIVSIGCRKARLNWDVIREDVRALVARLGRKVDEG